MMSVDFSQPLQSKKRSSDGHFVLPSKKNSSHEVEKWIRSHLHKSSKMEVPFEDRLQKQTEEFTKESQCIILHGTSFVERCQKSLDIFNRKVTQLKTKKDSLGGYFLPTDHDWMVIECLKKSEKIPKNSSGKK